MKSKPILPFVVVGLLVRQWMTTIVLALATHSAVAAPPGMIAHQGRIMAGGTGFHGTGQFKFAIVSSTGTQSFWSHDGTSNGGGEPNTFVPLEVVRGIYSVQLGDTSLAGMAYALPAELFSLQDDLRLRVWFNDGVHGFQYLSPDVRLTSVPYALAAKTVTGPLSGANLIPGSIPSSALAPGSVQSAALAPGAVDTDKLSPEIGVWENVEDSALRSTGKVGIGGWWAPEATLDVFGTVRIIGTGGFPHLAVEADNWAPFGSFLSLDARRVSGGKQFLLFSTAGWASEGPGKFIIKDQTELRYLAVFDSSGFLGINTTTPLAPMHIAQRNAIGNILLLSGNPTNENPTQLAFGTTAESNGTSTIQSIAQAGISYGSLWLNPNGGSVRIGTGAGSFGVNTVYTNATFNVRRRTGDLVAGRFEDPSGNPKVCIDTSDFVLEISGEAYKSNGSPFWNTTSDRRLKSDVRPVDSALETLDRIQPVRFRYTEDHVSHHPGTPETPQYGVVAQEFAEVFPDFVSTNSDGFLGVNPAPLLYFNVAAIRELHSESRKQSSGLDDLRHRQDHLHHRVDEMERLKSENEELRQRLTVLEEAFRRLVGTGNPTPPPDPKR